jgi:hypothetical protein
VLCGAVPAVLEYEEDSSRPPAATVAAVVKTQGARKIILSIIRSGNVHEMRH